MKPEILVLGHVVKDITSEGWRAGGGVVYAAAQASALGLQVAAVTRCSSDVLPGAIVPGVDWHVLPSDISTSFDNRYVNGRREQRVPSVAEAISFDDVPSEWRDAPVVLLAPVFHDVTPQCAAAFAQGDGLVGLGAQGWLRRLEGDRVVPGEVEPHPEWLAGDVVFVSEEDVVAVSGISAWCESVPIVVLTRGVGGCTVWAPSGRFELPGIPSEEKDPTGAGDVFATAFLVKLNETGDVRDSARFATAAGALAVREAGTAGIGNRLQIEALLRQEAVRA